MSSIRGRIDISDFRTREKQIEAASNSPYEDTYPSGTISRIANNTASIPGTISKSEMNMHVRQETDRISLQLKNFYELQLKEVVDRIGSLEDKSIERTRKIEELENENDKIKEELRNTKPKKEINIGKPCDTRTPKGLENKFDQLVKEVDQCFGELGRQMQRETKARQEIEHKISLSKKETELDFETKVRIEKLENAIKETQKVVHAPNFKLLSQATKLSGEVKSEELFKELEKLHAKIDEKDSILNDLKSFAEKENDSERKLTLDIKQMNNRKEVHYVT